MLMYKRLFMEHMDGEGVKYADHSDNVVKVTYGGDNLRSIPIYVVFDKEGDPLVQLKCWEIANLKSKVGKAMIACNELNNKYRWVKFYIDKDGDINGELDAIVDSATCGEECLSLVRRSVNIIDEAYLTFMKIIVADD